MDDPSGFHVVRKEGGDDCRPTVTSICADERQSALLYTQTKNQHLGQMCYIDPNPPKKLIKAGKDRESTQKPVTPIPREVFIVLYQRKACLLSLLLREDADRQMMHMWGYRQEELHVFSTEMKRKNTMRGLLEPRG